MRASGKTFRAVIEALKQASLGAEVFLATSHGHREALRVYEMAYRLCRESLSPDFVSGDRNRLVVRFKNGGHIHFTGNFHRDDLRGKKDVKLIEDV